MILVTGATGTVSPQVIRELINQNTKFRAGVHNRPFEIDSVETCYIDYDQPETLVPAFHDVHAVFLVLPSAFNGRAMLTAARNTSRCGSSHERRTHREVVRLRGRRRRIHARPLAQTG